TGDDHSHGPIFSGRNYRDSGESAGCQRCQEAKDTTLSRRQRLGMWPDGISPPGHSPNLTTFLVKPPLTNIFRLHKKGLNMLDQSTHSAPRQAQSSLERIKETDEEGNEYWTGRDLYKVLGYTGWHRILPAYEEIYMSLCIEDPEQREMLPMS